MGIRVMAMSNRGQMEGQMAGYYDFSKHHPDPAMRGGQGTKILVGQVFEIHDMSEFSDYDNPKNGRRGWMRLLDKVSAKPALDVAPPKPLAVPGQVPGQVANKVIPADVAVNLPPPQDKPDTAI